MLQGALRRLSEMNITAKFTLLFAAAILIPSVSLFFFSFTESRQSLKRELSRTAQHEFDTAWRDINSDIVRAVESGDRLAGNTDLREFLFSPYEFDAESLYRYRNVAAPIIEYAQEFLSGNNIRIKLYMVNDSIPEHWPFFYREDRISDRDRLVAFSSSVSNATWLYPVPMNFESEFIDLDTAPVFAYARKIYSTHLRYTGLITVNFPFSAVERRLADNESRHLDLRLYSAAAPEIFPGFDESAAGSNGAMHNGYLYFSKPLAIDSLNLVARTDLKARLRAYGQSGFMALLGVIIGLVILEIITYFAFERIFKRIHRMTGIMNRVAEGDFSLRIPKGIPDEIGQIAQDFNIMIGKINSLVAESVEREILQKDAQLKALQFQINPHFIYNTIDTFRMRLIMEESFEVADNLADFGQMLRYNMSDQNLFATLGEETEYIEKYSAIQRLRFNERIQLRTEIDGDALRAKILKFILQPIVENSILHGLGDDPDQQICITLQAYYTGESLRITVADDGTGMSAEQVAALRTGITTVPGKTLSGSSTGIGLRNIYRRLRLYYGEAAEMRIERGTTGGIITSLILPSGGTDASSDR